MELDLETLSRLQFALTIMFHYLFPPLTIGLGMLMVLAEGLWLKTEDAKCVHPGWPIIFGWEKIRES